jgi:hypothetical protein
MTATSSSGAMSVPVRRRSDADALDAICAVLNSTDSGADAYQAIAQLVLDADRPLVDDLPVVESYAHPTAHGLPRTRVLIDGEDAVVLWVDRRGEIHIRITTPSGRPISVEVDGSVMPCDTEPLTADR